MFAGFFYTEQFRPVSSWLRDRCYNSIDKEDHFSQDYISALG